MGLKNVQEKTRNIKMKKINEICRKTRTRQRISFSVFLKKVRLSQTEHFWKVMLSYGWKDKENELKSQWLFFAIIAFYLSGHMKENYGDYLLHGRNLCSFTLIRIPQFCSQIISFQETDKLGIWYSNENIFRLQMTTYKK